MQKTYIQAAVAILVTLVLAFGVKTAYISALGRDPETQMLEEVGNLMVEAQDVFGTNVDKFVALEEHITGHDGLVLIRGGDGSIFELKNGEFVPAEHDELVEGLMWLFDGTEAVNSDTEEIKPLHLYSVTVTEDRMLLYTGLSEGGSAGIVYDRTGRGISGLDTIQLYENWYQFDIIEDGGGLWH